MWKEKKESCPFYCFQLKNFFLIPFLFFDFFAFIFCICSSVSSTNEFINAKPFLWNNHIMIAVSFFFHFMLGTNLLLKYPKFNKGRTYCLCAFDKIKWVYNASGLFCVSPYQSTEPKFLITKNEFFTNPKFLLRNVILLCVIEIWMKIN